MPLTHYPSLGREGGDWWRLPSGELGWLSVQCSVPSLPLPARLGVRLVTGYIGRKKRTDPPAKEGRTPALPSPLPRGQATGAPPHPAPQLKDRCPSGGRG